MTVALEGIGLVGADSAAAMWSARWSASPSANVVRQGLRHDPRGDCVRRYVEEPAGVDDDVVREPWLLPRAQREALGYPAPIVDQDARRGVSGRPGPQPDEG